MKQTADNKVRQAGHRCCVDNSNCIPVVQALRETQTTQGPCPATMIGYDYQVRDVLSMQNKDYLVGEGFGESFSGNEGSAAESVQQRQIREMENDRMADTYAI